MKATALAAAAILALTVPAIAQQSGSQAQEKDQMAANASQTDAQDKLRQSLDKAGFEDIEIVDAAYLVHAHDADGRFTVIYIDPPATTTGSGSEAAASSAMSKSKVRESLENAGFTDVKIVDAAYNVRAKTAEGATAMMSVKPSGTTLEQGLTKNSNAK